MDLQIPLIISAGDQGCIKVAVQYNFGMSLLASQNTIVLHNFSTDCDEEEYVNFISLSSHVEPTVRPPT
jgi:hypothetical protein